MQFWKRVHWFVTSDCNQKCRFCFKPNFKCDSSLERVQAITESLVENKVNEVIFTGGEPLLLEGLNVSLETLMNAGIDTSIHTNATLLTSSKIKHLTNLVNEIAIPIDSIDRRTQKYLRRSDCLPKIKKVFNQLQDQRVRIGIHTVATSLNINHLPKIYDFLNKKKFDYWRIYEINTDLIADGIKDITKFKEVRKLNGRTATTSDGGVNCLFANFLLIEERMSKYRDKRIQFVGVSDYDKAPYFFLDAVGNVYFCNWFLQSKRKYTGNILKEDFKTVRDKAIQADAQGPLFDEEAFINTEQDQPLWVRAAWQGNYFQEELENVSSKYQEKFIHLSQLYLSRLKKQKKLASLVLAGQGKN